MKVNIERARTAPKAVCENCAPDGYGATTYESTITAHDGIQVHVRVTLPIQLRWELSGERVDSRTALPAIAHNAAADAMRNIDNARNEVPF